MSGKLCFALEIIRISSIPNVKFSEQIVMLICNCQIIGVTSRSLTVNVVIHTVSDNDHRRYIFWANVDAASLHVMISSKYTNQYNILTLGNCKNYNVTSSSRYFIEYLELNKSDEKTQAHTDWFFK